MAGGSALERMLRRDRALVAAGLTAAIAAAWLYLLAGAGMVMPAMEGMAMPVPAWSPGYAVLMLGMWAVMMAAMMLPGAAPMILLYASIARRRRSQGGAVPNAGIFALGYVAAWGGFSVAAVALQFGLAEAALISPAMRTTSTMLAGSVLIGAGVWQWTPLKDACLRHCRSPLEFVLGYWREGAAGAFRMGLRHGAYCLGCCWMLMVLLFVGGVMNLLWIAGLALYVLIEKIAPGGRWIGRAAGAFLVGWGGAVLIGAA